LAHNTEGKYPDGRLNEQFYSSPIDIEKKKQKTLCNKHQNTIDMQDYQAVTRVYLQNKLSK